MLYFEKACEQSYVIYGKKFFEPPVDEYKYIVNQLVLFDNIGQQKSKELGLPQPCNAVSISPVADSLMDTALKTNRDELMKRCMIFVQISHMY